MRAPCFYLLCIIVVVCCWQRLVTAGEPIQRVVVAPCEPCCHHHNRWCHCPPRGLVVQSVPAIMLQPTLTTALTVPVSPAAAPAVAVQSANQDLVQLCRQVLAAQAANAPGDCDGKKSVDERLEAIERDLSIVMKATEKLVDDYNLRHPRAESSKEPMRPTQIPTE